MQYRSVVSGSFIDRPNRFVARVKIGDEVHTVHVKNTGRCRELLVPGAAVYLEQGSNPNRKTQYDLIAVEKGDRLINMDSQAPNQVFGEWVSAGGFLPGVTAVRREYTYGGSRLDFCLETPEGPHFVEVKQIQEIHNRLYCFRHANLSRYAISTRHHSRVIALRIL